MKKEEAFVGEFKELLLDYVRFKRNLGYKYDTTPANLRRFSEFSLHYDIVNKSLSRQLVLDWTARRKNEGVKTWEHRSSDLRQFALYLQDKGYDAFIPLGKRKVSRGDFVPYIFTHDEIECFFKACDSILPHPLSNKHDSYPLLFRLLYCCGLRISEAIHLKVSDVDLHTGVLFIRESKFNKDRLIPMSESLREMCMQYTRKLSRHSESENYFLRLKKGTPLNHSTVYKSFRELLWKAGISHGGKGKGPRLHDLRHTFCVHTIASQVNNGIDLYCALPILSAYLGHTSVAATQHYVRLTVEAYPELMEQVSRTCAYIFPEVELK
ncbi:tyrosine-type recombinase/integrase [Paenibacillus alkaliterrae]|uniref:tyrosine-type recombinase/integrase n=1 Tax=Paenibacillus alkaliterrae TaxID=320909 RepID=UPI001F1894A5|nr:tyrosine-type recombinase/integrase [Paenibacillus alkaliterrae]MCF2941834.1 tyrosine-type recombinase/integrase [Paenibacillus alkaliterrae]